MSRELPARPNLEHLRKQAKALLRDLQTTKPDAKHADALHAVAREYGFASWPRLKTHVLAARAHHAASTESPFDGRWIANVARSQRHPAQQFRSAAIDFAVDDGLVTMSHEMVDESGRPQESEMTIEADGVEHVAPNGYSLTATWRGQRVLDTVATKDGQVVGRGTYEVSPDGSTLTITGPEQVIVLEKSAV